jgi:branched-chain amino acid transport system substrate-binding protein
MSVTRVNDAILIIRECVKQGWNPKLIFFSNSNGVTDKAYDDGLGKYGDGQILSTIWCNLKAADAEAIVNSFETDYPDQRMDANAGCAFKRCRFSPMLSSERVHRLRLISTLRSR